MIRRAACVVLAMALSPALVHAQEMAMTVNVPSAEVHKGPSTVTPVIGHAARGTVLPIGRNLGSWVRVPWPDAPDGVGYVHVTMGRIAAAGANAAASAPAPQKAPTPAPGTMPANPPQTRTPIDPRLAPRSRVDATPASHMIGFGGLIGSPETFGATARAWSARRLGVQLGLERATMTSAAAAGNVTSMQFEPGVVYGLFDHVSDYVWIRPYVGSALTIGRQTLTGPIVGAPAVSDTSVGFRVFGGGELTFAAAPRFGLSADIGYRRFPTPFAGFDTERLSLAVAGHWYVR